jgi:hypothetical protein
MTKSLKKVSGFFSHHNITRQGYVGSGSGSNSVDRSDDRNFQSTDHPDDWIVVIGYDALHFRPFRINDFIEVLAGAKCFPFTRDHKTSCAIRATLLEQILECQSHLPVEAIEPMRPVKPDCGYITGSDG